MMLGLLPGHHVAEDVPAVVEPQGHHVAEDVPPVEAPFHHVAEDVIVTPLLLPALQV